MDILALYCNYVRGISYVCGGFASWCSVEITVMKSVGNCHIRGVSRFHVAIAKMTNQSDSDSKVYYICSILSFVFVSLKDIGWLSNLYWYSIVLTIAMYQQRALVEVKTSNRVCCSVATVLKEKKTITTHLCALIIIIINSIMGACTGVDDSPEG